MPTRHISAQQTPEPIRAGIERLRSELEVPSGFPDDVQRAADQAAQAGPLDAERWELGERVDHTQIDFVTIDPEGSMDLDQALFLERLDDGFRVWYAIADVAAWVEPGGPVDSEAHRRGQTFYAPIERAPLHPSSLSEGAASLLADGKPRPALVWQVELDATGAQRSATVQRSLVRSRERLDYLGVQKMLDDGTAPEWLQLLREVGQLREQQEISRGGVSLNLPEQEIVAEGDRWRVEFRSPLPVEGWNAQISLLTGMAAADMMLAAGAGILRTLPPAEERDVQRLKATARSLQIPWPQGMGYPDFVRSLDVSQPRHLAMMTSCTRLFRGAAYTVVGPETAGQNLKHNALAAHYAHCTAPLRRLVDRYVGEICVHLCSQTPIPQWVTDALAALPDEMRASDQRAKKFERGVVDLTEALVLSSHVGQEFTGTIVDYDDKRGEGTISIAEPATEGRIKQRGLELGQEVTARLDAVDLNKGTVVFAPQ
ncbi:MULTISPECIES: RNB domain-containing ribonuclease [unclassified Luteococcus]|uniref:RNB domain-containing ribonuclease n=1 Tax=unclassified Luteococcus TaxID=2639923 RepID=UPI00313C2351